MKKNKLPNNGRNPFKVPEDYFGSLEDRILQKVALTQDGDRDFDLMANKKDPGFKVPENYFESFEDRLMTGIETKPKQSKVISLLNREAFYYIAGTAAVFVAIISTMFTNPAQPVTFEDLDVVSIEGYLHETLDFSTTDVSRYFNEGEYGFAPATPSYVDQEAVIDYLSEHVEEPIIIINED